MYVHFFYIGKLSKQCFKQNLIDFNLILDLNIFSVGPRSCWRNAYYLKSHFMFILQTTRYCCWLKENHAMCPLQYTEGQSIYILYIVMWELCQKSCFITFAIHVRWLNDWFGNFLQWTCFHIKLCMLYRYNV